MQLMFTELRYEIRNNTNCFTLHNNVNGLGQPSYRFHKTFYNPNNIFSILKTYCLQEAIFVHYALQALEPNLAKFFSSFYYFSKL